MSGQQEEAAACPAASLPHSLCLSSALHSEPVTLLMLLNSFCFLEDWMPLLFAQDRFSAGAGRPPTVPPVMLQDSTAMLKLELC